MRRAEEDSGRGRKDHPHWKWGSFCGQRPDIWFKTCCLHLGLKQSIPARQGTGEVNREIHSKTRPLFPFSHVHIAGWRRMHFVRWKQASSIQTTAVCLPGSLVIRDPLFLVLKSSLCSRTGMKTTMRSGSQLPLVSHNYFSFMVLSPESVHGRNVLWLIAC